MTVVRVLSGNFLLGGGGKGGKPVQSTGRYRNLVSIFAYKQHFREQVDWD